MKFIDLTGKKFGRLTVLGSAGNKGIQPLFTCKCDCGKICEIRGDKLRSGKTQSCGCLQKEYLENANGERSRKFEIGGVSYTIKDVLEITHLSNATFYRRLKAGYTVEELLQKAGGIK